MRARTASVATRLLPLACLLALPLPARAEAVEGRVARIDGLTREDSSFSGRVLTAGTVVMYFSEEGTFHAPAVEGHYRQQGRQLRFRVDPEMLEAYATSWELAFAASLAEDGLEPDRLHCRVHRSKVKARVRGDRIKFKSTYKIRCTATGDFGHVTERARVAFRGRGLLEDAAVAPALGLGWNHLPLIVEQGPGGDAGAGVHIISYVQIPEQDASVHLLAHPDVVLLPRLEPIDLVVQYGAGLLLEMDRSATLEAVLGGEVSVDEDDDRDTLDEVLER